MTFLEDVLGEVIDLFPSEYIHVGGDECPKVRWKSCPKCQARIKAEGIKGDSKHTAEEYLQSYVISRMEKFVESKGLYQLIVRSGIQCFNFIRILCSGADDNNRHI